MRPLPLVCTPFAVRWQSFILHGDRCTPTAVVGQALILHGGGTSAGAGFAELRQTLLDHGIESLVFDAVGHGKTGGSQLGTTLADRVGQCLAVIAHQQLQPQALTLLGFSMGAYVAVKVAERAPLAGLCLAIPAAYSAQAFHLPFGNAFSQCIRQPRSWDKSDAFDVLGRYPGRLLVLAAGKDVVIPAEIPGRLYQSAQHASAREHHVVAESGHDLGAHYALHPPARLQAYAAILHLWA